MLEAWREFVLKLIINPAHLLGFAFLLLVLDKLKAWEKFMKWNKARKHKRADDDEGEGGTHVRKSDRDEDRQPSLSDLEEKHKEFTARINTLEEEVKYRAENAGKAELAVAEIKGRVTKLESDNQHHFNQSATLFSKVDDVNKKLDIKFDAMTLKIDKQYSDLTQLIIDRTK